MHYTATTLGQLREAVNSLIEEVGEDTPVGNYELANETEPAGIGDYVLLEWVHINAETGYIVGTEADDYESKLKPGEVNAISIA